MVADGHNYFSVKKTTVSFVLALFVFYIHFNVFSAFSDAGALLSGVLSAIRRLTHVAVPLFFVISGALFYRNYTLAATLQKWKSRFFSLCIPYLFWNTAWFVLGLLGYYTPLGVLTGGVKVAFSPEALLRGVFLHEQFVPFWFMLQLIVLTALCPLIYLLLKNKWIGLVTIVAVYLLYCFGLRLDTTVLGDTGMVVFYLLGAWIGMHSFDLFASRKSKQQAIAGALVYILCCIFVGLETSLPAWVPTTQIMPVIKMISCAAFWIAFDYFEMRGCPKFMKESFLIYAMHSFVGSAIVKILHILLPKSQLSLALIAVFSFPFTVAIICAFAMLLGKYMPRVKRILAGR